MSSQVVSVQIELKLLNMNIKSAAQAFTKSTSPNDLVLDTKHRNK